MKRIVIIGFGEMGKRHGLDVEEHSKGNIKVAGVFEPSQEKYQEGCEWMNSKPKLFNKIEDMLNEIKPDGAIISSPNFCHLEALKKFKGKSIPLIIEKPLESTQEKIFEVVRFCQNYTGPIMVHHVMRFSPIIKKAKNLINSNSLGKLCSFRFSQTIVGGCMHNFRRNKLTGGGQLLEKATHDFDIILYLMNSGPKSVSAICKQQYFGGQRSNSLSCSKCKDNTSCPDAISIGTEKTYGKLKDINISKDLCAFAKDTNIPDNEVCMLELDNGIFGTYSQTYFVRNYYSRVYEIIGTKGVMRICFSLPAGENNIYGDGKIEIYGQDRYERFEFDYNNRIHYNGSPGVTKHFYELMNGEKCVYSPVDQAFAAEMIALAAYKSNNLRSFVEVKSILPNDLKNIFKQSFLAGS